jgi:hypothetical protein
VIAAAGIAACGFSPTLVHDGGSDSKVVDAGPCQTLSAECADDSTLRACAALGQPPIDTTCAWGCLGSSDARCGALVPTGSGATPDDVGNSTGLLDVAIDADISGDDGTIKNTERDPGLGINHGIDYEVVNGQAVFRAKSWHFTNDVVIVGALPVIFVATGDIAIDKAFDARGKCTGAGAGPGGFAGSDLDATGSGGGLGGPTADPTQGGGGGGHGSVGGDGGNNAASGGHAFGDLTLAILVGGGGGGGGGGGVAITGGGGGGAVQLVAGGTITIGPNANVDAGGCGGIHGGNNDSGGGGGAGGAILLEGLAINLHGIVAANGGGGGAGGGGTSGSKGSANRTPAPGGPGGDGDGGSGAAGGVAALPGMMASHSGGGGGGVGIIRLNTRTGSASVDSPTLLSPNFDDPQTTTTQGSARVQ